LHSGIATVPGGLRNLHHQVACTELFDGLPIVDVLGPPILVLDHGAHEVVGDAHGVVGVLEEDGAVGRAVNRAVVALFDEHMGFVLAKSMMEPMSSLTELIKQAEHCGLAWTPTLNHTGELKAIFCSTSRWVSSSRKASREAASAKYPPSLPQRTMVLATQLMSCRTEDSRSGVPILP